MTRASKHIDEDVHGVGCKVIAEAWQDLGGSSEASLHLGVPRPSSEDIPLP